MSAVPPPPLPRQPYQQPHPQPPRRRTGLIVGLVVGVVVLALVVVGAVVAVGRLQAAVARPSAVVGPTGAKPTFAPQSSVSYEDPRAAIPTVYAGSLGGACPTSGDLSTWELATAAMERYARCVDEQLDRVLAPTGKSFLAPRLEFVTADQVPGSSCTGVAEDPERYPAMYCRGDGAIYVHSSMMNRIRLAPSFAFVMIAHEHTHALQAQLNTWEGDRNDPQQLRRHELQAQCLAMHAYARTTGLDLPVDADLAVMRQQWTNDLPVHGSGASRTRWNEVGLAATTIGACDTWSAPADQVT